MTQTLSNSNNGSTDLENKIKKVYELFTKAFTDYKVDEVFLSFNGGKDCTVLLDLVKNYFNSVQKFKDKSIRIIYIQPTEPFDEVEQFVLLCEKTYGMPIEKKRGKLKQILEEVCENKELKAVIMGSRRTDPHCQNLKYMQVTDKSWPCLMRINPLLDWTCQDIWKYIKERKVPFCMLYNQGYTSLGDRTNTKPNPYLKVVDKTTGEISYRPAYELLNDDLERAGRQ